MGLPSILQVDALSDFTFSIKIVPQDKFPDLLKLNLPAYLLDPSLFNRISDGIRTRSPISPVIIIMAHSSPK